MIFQIWKRPPAHLYSYRSITKDKRWLACIRQADIYIDCHIDEQWGRDTEVNIPMEINMHTKIYNSLCSKFSMLIFMIYLWIVKGGVKFPFYTKWRLWHQVLFEIMKAEEAASCGVLAHSDTPPHSSIYPLDGKDKKKSLNCVQSFIKVIHLKCLLLWCSGLYL